MNEIKNEARFFAKAIKALCERRRIGGKVVDMAVGARHLTVFVRLADSLMLDKALKLSDNLALTVSAPNVRAGGIDGTVAFEFELKHYYEISLGQELKNHSYSQGLHSLFLDEIE